MFVFWPIIWLFFAYFSNWVPYIHSCKNYTCNAWITTQHSFRVCGVLVPGCPTKIKIHRLMSLKIRPYGRRRGRDVSREQHRNMYTVKDETDHQPRLDAWDKRSDLVLWEDLEGAGREGGGRGDRDGEDMWTQGLFISMYDKIHYK